MTEPITRQNQPRRLHSQTNTQATITNASIDTETPATICKAWISAFLDHGIYMRGWSTGTCRTYRQGLATLAGVPLTKGGLIGWMRTQQQRGLTPGRINMFARSINSFLSFACEEGWITELVRIRLLPDPPKPIIVLDEIDHNLVQRIQQTVTNSTVVCFLGFSYDKGNLVKLGFPKTPQTPHYINRSLGSAFGLTPAECGQAVDRLGLTHIGLGGDKDSCLDLLNNQHVLRD